MHLDMDDVTVLSEQVLEIVMEVSNIAFEEDITVSTKGQGNFVSSADLKIEQELKKSLRKISPDIGFITEEEKSEERNEYNWIIDPIDGTTNYLNGFPFAISLALEDRVNESIVLGIVYNPVEKTLYYATKGKGSYKIDRLGRKTRIHVGEFNENEGISIFGMPYNRSKSEKILKLAEGYYKISSDLKRIGPSSLDICRVASGQAKLYFELDLNIWDIAAGLLILEEAGGSYKKLDDLYIFCAGNGTDV